MFALASPWPWSHENLTLVFKTKLWDEVLYQLFEITFVFNTLTTELQEVLQLYCPGLCQLSIAARTIQLIYTIIAKFYQYCLF